MAGLRPADGRHRLFLASAQGYSDRHRPPELPPDQPLLLDVRIRTWEIEPNEHQLGPEGKIRYVMESVEPLTPSCMTAFVSILVFTLMLQ